MTEPDPKPEEEVTAVGNGSGPPKDSGAETVPVNKHEEQKKGFEELKVRNENDSAEGMNREGEHGVKEVKDRKGKNGVEEDPDGNTKNSAGETEEAGDKSDLKEMDGVEETKEKEEKDGIINGVEETKKGDNKDSMKDVNDDKDTKKMNDEKGMKKVEEKTTTEEKEGVDKMRDGEGKTIGEENIDSGEKEGSEVKKDEGGKMDMDKRADDKEEKEGEKGIEDVEMVEAEDVKEEDRVGKDERTENEVKPGEMGYEKEKDDGGSTANEVDGSTKAKTYKKKRSRSGRKVDKKVEAKEVKKAGEATEKQEGMKKAKEKLSSLTPSIERPVRERKTVERLVEVIEKEPNKGVVIEKGRGTTLKNIPNVAHKLARKKPGDLKLLHQILFGRKGKVIDFKNHILQFSGFAWHENDEKQRVKVKERLEKCVKDTLLDLCDLLDISVSNTNSRKEDLITRLLDFMAAPHATTDVLIAEKDQQSPKPRKRKMVARGSASKGTEDTSAEQFRKKRMKSEVMPSSKKKSAVDTDDDAPEKEDSEHGVPDEDEELERSESEKESESKEEDEKDKDEDKAESADEDSGKGKKGMKRSPKKQSSSKKEKLIKISSKRPMKTPSSMQSKPDESNDVGEKVFVRKKKNVDPPRKKSTAKPDVKEKSSGKRGAGSKAKSEGAGQSNPSKEELRKAICEILKKVDFNTATFTDILKQLAIRFKVDLTPRKAAIKLMIQEELTKLAGEAEDDEDEQDSEKEEHPEPTGKKVEV